MKPAARIPELDGLRGLAIALVVLHHYVATPLDTSMGWLAGYISRALSISWCGVDLFFVLSGFLIGGILMDQRNASNYFRVFYLRRACRIFPAYLGWLVIWMVMVWFVLGPKTSDNLGYAFGYTPTASPPHSPVWIYWAFVQNFYTAFTYDLGPHWLETTWSLALEEQFYLLLPLLIWLCRPRWLPYVVLALMGLPLLLRTFVDLYFGSLTELASQVGWPGGSRGFFIYEMLPTRMDSLFLGVFCALLVRDQHTLNQLKRRPGLLYIPLVPLTIAVIWLSGHASVFSNTMATWGFFYLAAFYACVLMLAVLHPRGWIGGFLRLRPLTWLGTVSYGVYLFHQGVNYLLHGLILHQPVKLASWRDVAVTALSLGVTLTLAWLSWRYFERPIVERGQAHRYEPAPAER